MTRPAFTPAALVAMLLLAACGDPKGAAGAITPKNAAPMDPSKMDQKVRPPSPEVKLDVQNTRDVKLDVESKMGDGSVVPAPTH